MFNRKAQLAKAIAQRGDLTNSLNYTVKSEVKRLFRFFN